MDNLAYDKMRGFFKETNQDKPRIMIVDDDELIRHLMSRILSRDGYQYALAADDAAEARNCLKDQNFDLILCDVKMPGESGIEFIRDIEAQYPDIAVMMVTAIDDPEVADCLFENIQRREV